MSVYKFASLHSHGLPFSQFSLSISIVDDVCLLSKTIGNLLVSPNQLNQVLSNPLRASAYDTIQSQMTLCDGRCHVVSSLQLLISFLFALFLVSFRTTLQEPCFLNNHKSLLSEHKITTQSVLLGLSFLLR